MITKAKALIELGFIGGWKIKENQIVKWWSEKEQPSEEEIQAKIAELTAAEPMRLLRLERDRLITATDWWVLPDRTPTQGQLDYRQALRDLPANCTPALDEDGNLTGVVWPEKPAT